MVAAADLDARALQLAGAVAASPPLASPGNKQVIQALRRAGRAAGDERLRKLRRRSLASAELRERVGAFVERRGSGADR